MGDEHLDTIPATESDEFIKSTVENLVPSPSESEDYPTVIVMCLLVMILQLSPIFSLMLTTISSSSDDESFSDEDISKKIYLNPLFDEEIISMKIDPHYFNAESDLIESLLDHNSSIIYSSSKIDSLLDEFRGELILLKSIPPGIAKADCDPEEEIRLIEKLLYDNSLVTDTIKSDKIQAKPDKTKHKTESVEKSTVKSQQKVKPDKIKAKETKKSRKIKKRD
nr:hypothetical protein [Tanacetum cinerariifolium]